MRWPIGKYYYDATEWVAAFEIRGEDAYVVAEHGVLHIITTPPHAFEPIEEVQIPADIMRNILLKLAAQLGTESTLRPGATPATRKGTQSLQDLAVAIVNAS